MTMDSPKSTEDPPIETSGLAWVDLWEQLNACHRSLQSQLSSAAEQFGLRVDEAAVICLLGKERATAASQRQLSRTIGVSPAKMSGLLEGLRERKLLIPTRDSADRRRQFWQLTTLGKQLGNAITLSLNANSIPSAEFGQLRLILDQMSRDPFAFAVTDSSNNDGATGPDGRERAA